MIYVFKTTVHTETHVQELQPYLDKFFPAAKWNFDLEDCDHIFRIESTDAIPDDEVQSVFKAFDFDCEELE